MTGGVTGIPPGIERPGVLRLGTRGSALALAQSRLVAEAIEAATGARVELVTIRSEGDEIAGPLTELGTTGVFATRLRVALLEGRCDLLVHSFKDLPVDGYPGLRIGAVPPRAAVHDALCARDGATLAGLPAGARVGTGSPRRAAAILRLRPDLELVPIRGNVGTRLALRERPPEQGGVDAVVLAAAGLDRVGLADEVTHAFSPSEVMPAPAQGALAVEVRESETDPVLAELLADALAAVDDPASHAAARAERAVLAELEAGCTAPIGAHATPTPDGGSLTLTARVVHPAGTSWAEVERVGAIADPDALGHRVGAALRDELRGTADLAGVLA